MLKNILKLEGAQKLTKNEQKSINGGGNCRCSPLGIVKPGCKPCYIQ
jgi:hypothetical protein